MIIKNLERIKSSHLYICLTYLVIILCDILFTEAIDEIFIVFLVLIWLFIIKFMKIKGIVTLGMSIGLFILSFLIGFTNRDTLLEKTFSYSFILFVIYNIQNLLEPSTSEK